jgi:hypothetical protein
MRRALISAMLLMLTGKACAQQPFLSAADWQSLLSASSGAVPYDNLRFLTTLHRVPATAPFDEAAQFMLERARAYGLKEVHAEAFIADGETHYGLMRANLGWQVTGGQLLEAAPTGALLADWRTDPIRLADYSHSAHIEANLLDVGEGTNESDYAGKAVRGNIVLAGGVLSTVQQLAVLKLGALGIVSDMQNQITAWSGEDSSLVRWGHLDPRASTGFAFMVSRATARALRARLLAGETVRLKADVDAEVVPGHWTVVSALLPGSDPAAGEIVFSCHLDHQRPGANDNGSGCVTILESARILAALIEARRLAPPRRTLRFLFGPEVEGTMAYLAAHPDIRAKLRADVHMDMVGGDPFKNKAVLHVTETPWSLPSFVTDVGASFAELIRSAAAAYAEGEGEAGPAVLETRNGGPGTRNAFFVDVTPYAEGSDHDDYDSSTIAVPSLYLRDWPDLYIHTDHDSLTQIDATKLRRVALLGAAAGYSYAMLDASTAPRLAAWLTARAEARLAQSFARAQQLLTSPQPDARYEAHNLVAQSLTRELRVLQSFARFCGSMPDERGEALLKQAAASEQRWLDQLAEGPRRPPDWRNSPEARRVPHRIGEFGPLTYQNDDVLLTRLGAQRVAHIELLGADTGKFTHEQQSGALYAYEIVNFVDGVRSVGEIRDAVAAEFGPLPLHLVSDYLRACEEARIIEFRETAGRR